jgi:hypothetical protein
MFILAFDISYETWALLAFAAVSVFGGLLKKKMDSAREQADDQSPPAEASQLTTLEHPRPGVDPSRPPRAAPTPARSAAAVEPLPFEPARAPALPRARPQPVPPARTPVRPTHPPAVARRVEELARPQRKRPETRPRKTRPPERTRKLGTLEEHELVRLKDTIGAPKAVEHRRAVGPAEKLNRVLRTRSGLQAAVLLSEILAPPLALRDNPRS